MLTYCSAAVNRVGLTELLIWSRRLHGALYNDRPYDRNPVLRDLL